MERRCPNCNIELVKRSMTYVCPRHDIGECTYEPTYFDKADDYAYPKKSEVVEREADTVT
ncbi:hypothetical protein M9194_02015 [Vibrio sp. S4M6]|uniref:hypothetical protein n=1 Tax=Vibrio sinus TaxID=2946865 RepID=UPI00202AB326|nr:hypothetical protein [Vibrio sinus]MCL9780205.1 hypothetical protein [Vibrio sinus]